MEIDKSGAEEVGAVAMIRAESGHVDMIWVDDEGLVELFRGYERLTAEVERLNGLVCISHASAKVAVDAMERVYSEAIAVGYKAEDICDAVQEFEAAASIINPPTQG